MLELDAACLRSGLFVADEREPVVERYVREVLPVHEVKLGPYILSNYLDW